jgi:hypothetical protein
MWVTDGAVWSVDPGRSACLACEQRQGLSDADADADAEVATVLAGLRLHATRPRTNRGIGPIAGLLGALGAFELLRYLTRYEPPAYTANPLFIDFAAGCATRQQGWPRDPRRWPRRPRGQARRPAKRWTARTSSPGWPRSACSPCPTRMRSPARR